MLKKIDEGYDERVQAVADEVKQIFPNGVPKSEFESAVENAAQKVGASEMRRSVPGLGQNVGDSRKDFLKDVKAKIGRFRADNSKAKAKKERIEKVMNQLMLIIDDAIGNSFPDGDPFDHIWPKARALGVPANDVLEWLDRTIRKNRAGKSYHDYLSKVWDDYTSGNMGHGDQFKDLDNPWH